MARTPVVIVGGGPVGLTLALELAWHGVACTILERRVAVDHLRPRAKTTNVRSMEHFRRLGVADAIRSRAPLRPAWNRRATFCTSLGGVEIASFDDIFAIRAERDDDFAECGQQITQPLLEDVLRDAVSGNELITFLVGVTVVTVSQDARGVAAEYDDASGGRIVLDADYAVGADGAGSITRGAAGIAMDRGVQLPTNISVTFRMAGLDRRSTLPTALHYWVVNSTTQGVIMRLDPTETYSATVAGVSDPETDPHELIERLTGFPVDAEILATDAWAARITVADSYSRGRIFLAGDAAHQNPPWGGHGFNTGIGDAVNLGWKLAATLNGWAGERLLASYEPERRPIAEQTIAVAAGNMRAISPATLEAIADDPQLRGPGAPAIRDGVREAKDGEFHSLGLVLGYRYDASPIIHNDGPNKSTDALDPVTYAPSWTPGARMPHRWLADGGSVYDLLGDGFTLFVPADCTGWPELVDAAMGSGVPLVVHAGTEPEFVLVRSDGHIAWHGKVTEPGPDPRHILDQARGLVREQEMEAAQ